MMVEEELRDKRGVDELLTLSGIMVSLNHSGDHDGWEINGQVLEESIEKEGFQQMNGVIIRHHIQIMTHENVHYCSFTKKIMSRSIEVKTSSSISIARGLGKEGNGQGSGGCIGEWKLTFFSQWTQRSGRRVNEGLFGVKLLNNKSGRDMNLIEK